MILRVGVKTLLSLFGLSLFAPATAQIQVLINDKGRTIAIPQNLKERDEFIIERMRHAGGSWRVQIESGEKGCIARRSVSSLKKGVGTKWVVGRGETSREAELDARNQAMAITGTTSAGNWEQGFCNKAEVTVPRLDLDALETKAGLR